MINKPKDWEEIQVAGQYQRLPAGGYVIEIKNVEVKQSESGNEYLDLTIDICEGMYAGYFTSDYESQNYEPKRYKGHYRQLLPKNESSTAYFKSMVLAIEQSNPGYVWNWDEHSLVGKKAGCLFRDEEWEYNGKTGLRTSATRLTDADKIRKGEFTPPAPKYLDHNDPRPGTPAGTQVVENAPFTFTEIKDDEFPF